MGSADSFVDAQGSLHHMVGREAAGDGEKAQEVNNRLALINPSAAQAISCLIDANAWDKRPHELSNQEDRVGPLTGTVYYKYDKESEKGVIPLIVVGAMAATGLTGSQLLALAGIAAGATMLAVVYDGKVYEQTAAGILHLASVIPTPAPKPPKEPWSDTKKVVVAAAIGSAGYVGKKLVDSAFDKKDDKPTGAESPKNTGESNPGSPPKNKDGNPAPVTKDPEPAVILEKDKIPKSPMIETADWFEEWQKEIAAEKAGKDALKLIQQLSVYHFADTTESLMLADGCSKAMTHEEQQELHKHYTEDAILQKTLGSIPIDFRKPDWNNSPESLHMKCSVADPVNPMR